MENNLILNENQEGFKDLITKEIKISSKEKSFLDKTNENSEKKIISDDFLQFKIQQKVQKKKSKETNNNKSKAFKIEEFLYSKNDINNNENKGNVNKICTTQSVEKSLELEGENIDISNKDISLNFQKEIENINKVKPDNQKLLIPLNNTSKIDRFSAFKNYEIEKTKDEKPKKTIPKTQNKKPIVKNNKKETFINEVDSLKYQPKKQMKQEKQNKVASAFSSTTNTIEYDFMKFDEKKLFNNKFSRNKDFYSRDRTEINTVNQINYSVRKAKSILPKSKVQEYPLLNSKQMLSMRSKLFKANNNSKSLSKTINPYITNKLRDSSVHSKNKNISYNCTNCFHCHQLKKLKFGIEKTTGCTDFFNNEGGDDLVFLIDTLKKQSEKIETKYQSLVSELVSKKKELYDYKEKKEEEINDLYLKLKFFYEFYKNSLNPNYLEETTVDSRVKEIKPSDFDQKPSFDLETLHNELNKFTEDLVNQDFDLRNESKHGVALCKLFNIQPYLLYKGNKFEASDEDLIELKSLVDSKKYLKEFMEVLCERFDYEIKVRNKLEEKTLKLIYNEMKNLEINEKSNKIKNNRKDSYSQVKK